MATLELNPIPAGEEVATTTPAQAAAPAKTAPAVDEAVKAAIASGMDAEALTRLYLKLRAAKSDLTEQAKKKMAPINSGMELIENHFLAIMLELGVDSLKNGAGTPYKTTKTSITVADNAAFVDFVLDRALQSLAVKQEARDAIKMAILESGQLALIEARASKSAVEALMEETKELPPGLNHRAEVTVNVKAS